MIKRKLLGPRLIVRVHYYVVCAFVLPTARSFTQDTGLSTVTRRTPVSPHVSP